MNLTRLMTATAAIALLSGAAAAQEGPAPSTPSEGVPAAQAGANERVEAGEVKPAGDIVATVKASGQFDTLIKALDATNLTGLLQNNSGLTVFAPTDAAFAALPAGELDRLMADENRAELQQLLTYHVVNARLDGTKIGGAKGPVPTVGGANIEIDGSGDTWMVGEAEIVQADIMADNGVIHVVDKVLMPGAAPAAAASADASGEAMNGSDMADEAPAAGADTGAAADTATTEMSGDMSGADAMATMQPIPDTPENRAEYGAPLSAAGKRTAANGN